MYCYRSQCKSCQSCDIILQVVKHVKYGINNIYVYDILMQLYAIDTANQKSSGPIQGHGDRHPQPHPDSLHDGVLAHPAPPGPTQQGQGYFAPVLYAALLA